MFGLAIHASVRDWDSLRTGFYRRFDGHDDFVPVCWLGSEFTWKN